MIVELLVKIGEKFELCCVVIFDGIVEVYLY